jgi:hypothetical protein
MSDVSQCSFDLRLGSVLFQSSAPQRSYNCVMPYGPRFWQSINLCEACINSRHQVSIVPKLLVMALRIAFCWRSVITRSVFLPFLHPPFLYPFAIFIIFPPFSLIVIPSLYSTVILLSLPSSLFFKFKQSFVPAVPFFYTFISLPPSPCIPFPFLLFVLPISIPLPAF